MRWEFSGISSERFGYLSDPPEFENICNRIIESAARLCSHWQESQDSNGFSRPVLCLCVESHLFDTFFNSANGYRAQYYESPSNGQIKNALFVRNVSDAILSKDTLENIDLARYSFSRNSAKAWLAEVEKHDCPACRGEWSYPQNADPEILNDRWEKSSNHCGPKAPLGTKIRLFGAFVNARLEEYVPLNKNNRAKEISSFGWS